MQYRYILIPGRHQAITNFQINLLKSILASDKAIKNTEVIWAVTSANHSCTQRNPIRGSRRLGIIEAVSSKENIASQIYLITNMTLKPNFAHYLIENIRLQSDGYVDMTPSNTLVVCSTESVAKQYIDLGYKIETAEYDKTFSKLKSPRPWDIVEEIRKSGNSWQLNPIIRDQLHPVCFEQYVRYKLGDKIVEVFQDPLIKSEDGDITKTRDYSVYRKAFEDGADRKVSQFIDYIKPGKILDIGCATGETLKILSKMPKLFESDFYGVEAALPLYQICLHRFDSGEFGDANIFFYHRNIMFSSLFVDNSMDTVITMALTHEIESYLGREELLKFLKHMYEIVTPGGVYINYDVVAPNNKNKKVYCLFNEKDGENINNVHPNISEDELPSFLKKLSTKSRFRRFVTDFRSKEGDQIKVEYETIGLDTYAVLRHADLCDFLAKKDYVDNWLSEMHERFCFCEYEDWVNILNDIGFEISNGSSALQNPWLIENRFAPAVSVFEIIDNQIVPVDQPVTNIILIARKPS